MVFTKFVEVGRVVLIKKGDDAGKIAVIAEILDHNRAIVDGPTSGVARQAISYRNLDLTELKVALPRAARTSVVKKVAEAAKLNEKWAATNAAKKIAVREARANLNDFGRFKAMILKQKKRQLLAQAVKA